MADFAPAARRLPSSLGQQPLAPALAPAFTAHHSTHPFALQPHTRTTSASSSTSGSGNGSGGGGGKRERQTRISEHLRAVKPHSPSPSAHKRSTSHHSTAHSGLGAQQHQVGKLSPRRMARFEGRAPVTPSRAHSSQHSHPHSLPEPGSIKQQAEMAAQVKRMHEMEAQQRLADEKSELLGRLAQHGLTPNSDVLDRALQSLNGVAGVSEEAVMSTFLAALDSPAQSNHPRHTITQHHQKRSIAPLSRPAPTPTISSSGLATLPSSLRVETQHSSPSMRPSPSNSFATLASPSPPLSSPQLGAPFSTALRSASDRSLSPPTSIAPAPSSANKPPVLAPAFEPRPAPRVNPSTKLRRAMSVGGKSLPTSFVSRPKPTVTILSPPPSAPHATPNRTRQDRLAAFEPAHVVPHASQLVAARVEGMGRVALRADVLVASLGAEPAGIAIAAAAQPAPTLSFGEVPTGPLASTPLLEDVFGPPCLSTFPRRARLEARRAGGPQVADERMGSLRSWLESAEMSAGEEEEDGPGGSRAAWSAIADTRADDFPDSASTAHSSAHSQQHSRAGPEEAVYVDFADESDEDAISYDQPKVRVGGKNVRVLVSAKRRREDDAESSVSADLPGALARSISAPSVSLSLASSAARADRKGKRRASVSAPTARERTPTPIAHKSIAEDGAEEEGEDVIACVCGKDEEDAAMVQCDGCQSWLHLACLGLSSTKKLPKTWFCFRCEGSDSARPPKRARQVTPTVEEQQAGRAALAAHEAKTRSGAAAINVFAAVRTPHAGAAMPPLHHEPVLVDSSHSPPRGAALEKSSSFSYSLNDFALAPSPQASPARGPPRSSSAYLPSSHYSPQQHHHAAMRPSTPTFGPRSVSRGGQHDFEPRSPLYYRGGRIRMVSGAFEDPPSAVLRDWDLGNEHSQGAIPPLDEDDLLLGHRAGPLGNSSSSWHDLTMTPSRSLCSSALGYATEGTLNTPLSARKRTASGAFELGKSSAQDFLAGLSNDEEHTHSVAQRLFAAHSPAPGRHSYASPHLAHPPPQFAHPAPMDYSYSAPIRSSSPHPQPFSSPLGPRRASPVGHGHHRKSSSLSGYNTPSQWAHGAVAHDAGAFSGAGMSSPGRGESYERRSESPTLRG